MRTYRRLDEPTKYYSLSWRGWLAAGAAGGVLYGAVRLSPLGLRATVTLTLFVLAFAGMALFSLSGQALGIGRYLAAIARWRTGPKHYLSSTAAPVPRGGVLVDAIPAALITTDDEPAPVWEDTPEPQSEARA